MDRCENYRQLIDSFFDRDIQRSDAQRLLEHLLQCEDCKNYLFAAGELSALVKQTAVEAPAELCSGVMDAIAALPTEISVSAEQPAVSAVEDIELEAPAPVRKKLPRRIIYAVSGLAAAAACVALVISIGPFGGYKSNGASASPESNGIKDSSMSMSGGAHGGSQGGSQGGSAGGSAGGSQGGNQGGAANRDETGSDNEVNGSENGSSAPGESSGSGENGNSADPDSGSTGGNATTPGGGAFDPSNYTLEDCDYYIYVYDALPEILQDESFLMTDDGEMLYCFISTELALQLKRDGYDAEMSERFLISDVTNGVSAVYFIADEL